MMAEPLREILEELAAGKLTVEQALDRAGRLAAEPLGFATLDHHRPGRCGMPEVVYAAGKMPDQVVSIARSLVERSGWCLITRAEPEHAEAIEAGFDTIVSGTRRRTFIVGRSPPVSGKAIPIITAGTSDEPAAEEAELTCQALGQASCRINDVGVAGLHRLIEHLPRLDDTRVVICIAGMEGALPSVLGGLVRVPVIAVPTSVGYGAAFGGITALLGMLTSCAAGVSVVNIDNGFGAAYTATLIQRQT